MRRARRRGEDSQDRIPLANMWVSFPLVEKRRCLTTGAWRRRRRSRVQVALPDPTDNPHSGAWRRRRRSGVQGRLHCRILETVLILKPERSPRGAALPDLEEELGVQGVLRCRILETVVTLEPRGGGGGAERKWRLHCRILQTVFTLEPGARICRCVGK